MERHVLMFGFLFLILTTENYGACDTNQIEDITKRDDMCAEVLRAQWNNNKTTMCNDIFHRRLCCKFCKSNPRKLDVHLDITRMLKEYYDVHQMIYSVSTTFTNVKPAITNANGKPA
ncbi:uncharacterized protein LOC111101355 isoform X2 [Crassostrea virginica]